MKPMVMFFLALLPVLTWAAASRPDADCDEARRLIEQAVQQKKGKRKIAMLQQAMVLCPEADAPHFYYGLALEEREDKKKSGGDYRAAEQAYRRVLTINPRHYPALYKLAGIEYISGQFDSAAIHFTRYLDLDAPNDRNEDTRKAATHLLVKCKWLALLPQGAVKNAALTRDPDRLAGVPRLLGDIAFELGRSAMQVTGNYNYGLAGMGVKVGIALLAATKDLGYNKMGKAYQKGNKAVAHEKGLQKLPDAVNDYGINSEVVAHVLRIVAISGVELALEAAASGSTEERELTAMEPFLSGALLAYESTLAPLEQPGGKLPEYTWDIPLLFRYLGKVRLALNDYQTALAYFQGGLVFLQEKSVAAKSTSEEEASFALWYEFIFRVYVAATEGHIATTHSPALQKLMDIWYAAQNLPDLKSDETLNTLLLREIIAWVDVDVRDEFQASRSAFNLRQLTRFTEMYARERPGDPFVELLEQRLFKAYVTWGELSKAMPYLSRLHPKKADPEGAQLFAARLFNATGLPDSALSRLQQPVVKPLVAAVHFEHLRSIRLLMLQHEREMALRLLMLLEQDERLDTLLPPCAASLRWLATVARNEKGPSALDQLQERWEKAARHDWESFKQGAEVTLQAMIFSENMLPWQKQLFDRLLAVAMADKRCRAEDADALRLAFYLATQQWDKALDSYSPAVGRAEEDPTIFGYLDERLSALALLYQKTGTYAKAAELRRSLLDRLLPYESILPENAASRRLDLAESLAALGKKQEALTLLQAAYDFYARTWPKAKQAIRLRPIQEMIDALAENKKTIKASSTSSNR